MRVDQELARQTKLPTAALLAATLISCSGEIGPTAGQSSSGPPDEHGPDDSEGSPPSGPTFHRDVSPIFVKQCAGCHAPGGVAPFPLLSYQDAAPLCQLIGQKTKAREMPPWGVDNSGDCQTYPDTPWLTDEEIDLIDAWVGQDCPAGDPSQEPPTKGEAEKLERVDLTLDMGAEYTPNPATLNEYRCFLLDPQLAESKFAVAYEFRPGDARTVHHAFLIQLTEAEEAALEAEDAADPDLGWNCAGAGGVGKALFIGYLPGVSVVRFPGGVGHELTAGRKLLLGTHYHTGAGVFPDRSRIDIELADSVEASPSFLTVGVAPTDPIPPHNANFEVEGETLIESDAFVWGVWPHMHTVAKTQHVEVVRAGGQATCMTDVPRYDFEWQGFYFYDAPMLLKAGDRVRTRCGYDSSLADAPISFGGESEQEMCANFLFATAP